MWGGGFELKGQRGNREARKSETRLSPQEKPVMLGFVPVGGGGGAGLRPWTWNRGILDLSRANTDGL